jgi:hypothetical protein
MKIISQTKQRANQSYLRTVEKFKPLSAAASIDTVELFFVKPPKGLRTSIESKLGRRVRIQPCLDKTGYSRGVRAVINRPTRALLPVLTSLVRDNRGACMHRVDIAVDLTMASQALADEFANFIDQHLVLKWRPTTASKDAYNTTKYWANGCRTRNLACYDKDLRKLRLELRFLNASSVRRGHLHIPGAWHSLNPLKHFERHLKVAMFTNRHVQKTMRRIVEKDRRSHIEKRTRSRKNTHSVVVDIYRARLAQRVQLFLDRIDMQLLLARNSSLGCVESLPLGELLKVPTGLTWPDQIPETSPEGGSPP